jgi:hypothetical protein
MRQMSIPSSCLQVMAQYSGMIVMVRGVAAARYRKALLLLLLLLLLQALQGGRLGKHAHM